MTGKRAKLDGMPFGEALARFAQTNPAEVKPPAGKKRKVPKKAKKLAKRLPSEHLGKRQKEPEH